MQKETLEIRLRYCGGCNPEINRASVVKRLEELIGLSHLDVRFNKSDQFDLLLLMNGCAHACLDEQNSDFVGTVPCVSVQGARFDHRPVPEEKLPYLIWQRIRGLLEITS
jgi:hypothetical protein